MQRNCFFITPTHYSNWSIGHVSSFQLHTTAIDAGIREQNRFNILPDIEATAYSYLIHIQKFEDIQFDSNEIPDLL